jgi:AcrR family transcriptional regulator
LNDRLTERGTARTRQRSEARRREILHAAARVFRRRGIAAAGMREIAAEANLSPGNLYHYFKGKHEILYYCQDQALERMLAAIGSVRGMRQPCAEQLRQVVIAHLGYLLDELQGSTAHLEPEALPEDLQRPVMVKRDRYERELRALIAEGVARGEFVAGDPALMTLAILGALNWTARWFNAGGRLSLAEVSEQLADYLIRGLQSERAARDPSHASEGRGR